MSPSHASSPPGAGPTRGRYPDELEHTWTPAGRPPVHIRPLHRDDLEREREFVRGLSPQTRYQRLQYYAAEPPPEALERLLDLDYVDRLAIGALARSDADGDEQIVGVSRYARLEGTGRAECAIVVTDAWQGCGLGSELMRTLVYAAIDRGFEGLQGETLAENVRIVSWARRVGFDVRTEPHSGGLVLMTLDLRSLRAAGDPRVAPPP